MRFTKCFTVVAVLAVMALAVGQAQAAMIGVQFTGFDGTRTLLATESAGLVPQINYNTLGYNDANGVDYRESIGNVGMIHPMPTLKDDSGAATTVAGTATGIWDMFVFGSGTELTPDQKLMSHAFGENGTAFGGQPFRTGTIALSNLHANGYALYDLIVYVTLNTANANDHPSTIALNGGAASAITIDGDSSYGSPDVTYVDALTNSVGNYVRYNGLTGDSVSFSITSPPWYNGAGFGGFQVILVPEPATLALLGLGGLGMLIRRKRS